MANVTLVSFLLRGFADSRGVKGPTALSRFLKLPRSTVRDWWNGIKVPKLKSQRALLYSHISHAVFSGGLTSSNRKRGLGPPTPQDRNFKFDFSPPFQVSENGGDERSMRVVCLIRAIIPDLKHLALSEGNKAQRDYVRTTLGGDVLNDFVAGVSALSSEQARDVRKSEGSLTFSDGGKS